jgi:hypothetical protein
MSPTGDEINERIVARRRHSDPHAHRRTPARRQDHRVRARRRRLPHRRRRRRQPRITTEAGVGSTRRPVHQRRPHHRLSTAQTARRTGDHRHRRRRRLPHRHSARPGCEPSGSHHGRHTHRRDRIARPPNPAIALAEEERSPRAGPHCSVRECRQRDERIGRAPITAPSREEEERVGPSRGRASNPESPRCTTSRPRAGARSLLDERSPRKRSRPT